MKDYIEGIKILQKNSKDLKSLLILYIFKKKESEDFQYIVDFGGRKKERNKPLGRIKTQPPPKARPGEDEAAKINGARKKETAAREDPEPRKAGGTPGPVRH